MRFGNGFGCTAPAGSDVVSRQMRYMMLDDDENRSDELVEEARRRKLASLRVVFSHEATYVSVGYQCLA